MADIDVYPKFYSHKTPVAKKDHTCCECGRKIAVGKRHHLHEGLWDHEFSRFRICNSCEFVRDEIQAGMRSYECVPFGCLVDEWLELEENYGKKRCDFLALIANLEEIDCS